MERERQLHGVQPVTEEGRFSDLIAYHLQRHKDDICVAISVACLSLGLALVCVGYIIPREYKFDPSLPAREMETIELHYANLSYYLDVGIVVGMGFIAAGVLMTSGLTVYKYLTGKDQVYRKEDRPDLNLLDETHVEMATYGTTEDNWEK